MHVDLFIDTSPCQPWSRCNGINAKGFKDSRAATFERANELYLRLKATNPAIKHIVENVVPARHLKKDQATMEEMWDSKFHEVNASQWAAGHSRPRNIATSICNIGDIPDQRCSDPNQFLSDDVYCKGQTVNCIVASDANTHNPATVFSRKNNAERLITVAEAESLLLWPRNVTNGGTANFGFERATRMKMIGNAIGGHHLREILYRWRIPKFSPIVNNLNARRGNSTRQDNASPDPAKLTYTELEAALSAMSDDELDSWIAQRSDGYTLPELDLEVEEGTGPYAKPGVSYSIPSGQVEAIMYQVKQQVDKG